MIDATRSSLPGARAGRSGARPDQIAHPGARDRGIDHLLGGSSGGRLGHADEPLVAGAAELDDTLAQREDRVVASETCARPGAETRPTLADDDHPRLDLLAREDLHTQPLRVRVAT